MLNTLRIEMNLNTLITRTANLSLRLPRNFAKCNYSKETSTAQEDNEVVNINTADLQAKFHEEVMTEEEEFRIRNKSRLNEAHRNIMHGRRPYDESMAWFHDTIGYKRKILGRYGLEAVGVPAGFAWPTKEEIEDKIEYEKIAYPQTIQETWKLIEEKKRLKAEAIKKREEEIEAKLGKLDEWRAALKAKLEKKEAELQAAQLKKEKLIEEVRRHFGFKIDPKDERFKEVLEKKEKEDKKNRREAKKKEKAARYLEKFKQAEKQLELKKLEEMKNADGPQESVKALEENK